MTISERIFELLKKKDKTQSALAEFLGIRVATVSAWKQKRTSPASDLLSKIADFFGVTSDYLLGREENEPAQGHLRQVKLAFLDGLEDMDKLSDSDLKQLNEIARYLIEKNKKETDK